MKIHVAGGIGFGLAGEVFSTGNINCVGTIGCVARATGGANAVVEQWHKHHDTAITVLVVTVVGAGFVVRACHSAKAGR